MSEEKPITGVDPTVAFLVRVQSDERKAQTREYTSSVDKLGDRMERGMSQQNKVNGAGFALAIVVICALAGAKLWIDASPDHVTVATGEAPAAPSTVASP